MLSRSLVACAAAALLVVPAAPAVAVPRSLTIFDAHRDVLGPYGARPVYTTIDLRRVQVAADGVRLRVEARVRDLDARAVRRSGSRYTLMTLAPNGVKHAVEAAPQWRGLRVLRVTPAGEVTTVPCPRARLERDRVANVARWTVPLRCLGRPRTLAVNVQIALVESGIVVAADDTRSGYHWWSALVRTR